MPWSTRHTLVSVMTMSAVSLGCDRADKMQAIRTRATGPVEIYTVNYPLKYFADRIGGEHVRVKLPAPSGVNPSFWTPDAETVSAYQQAEFILINGATYAKWIPKVTLPDSKLIDTSARSSPTFVGAVSGSVRLVNLSHAPLMG